MKPRVATQSGFTFVELMIALVILAIVGVVAANAIMTATQVDHAVRRRSRAAAACREVARIVGNDVANMACGEAFGRKAYSETLDPKTAERVIELLVSPPDGEPATARGVATGALVVRYTVIESADHTWRLERGVARLGLDGKAGDFETGVLVDGCHQISFEPVVEGESASVHLKSIAGGFSFLFDAADGPERFAISAESPLEPAEGKDGAS